MSSLQYSRHTINTCTINPYADGLSIWTYLVGSELINRNGLWRYAKDVSIDAQTVTHWATDHIWPMGWAVTSIVSFRGRKTNENWHTSPVYVRWQDIFEDIRSHKRYTHLRVISCVLKTLSVERAVHRLLLVVQSIVYCSIDPYSMGSSPSRI